MQFCAFMCVALCLMSGQCSSVWDKLSSKRHLHNLPRAEDELQGDALPRPLDSLIRMRAPMSGAFPVLSDALPSPRSSRAAPRRRAGASFCRRWDGPGDVAANPHVRGCGSGTARDNVGTVHARCGYNPRVNPPFGVMVSLSSPVSTYVQNSASVPMTCNPLLYRDHPPSPAGDVLEQLYTVGRAGVPPPLDPPPDSRSRYKSPHFLASLRPTPPPHGTSPVWPNECLESL